jgi:hypothetical protein
MALHPGEKGVCPTHGEYDEFCSKCAEKPFVTPDEAELIEEMVTRTTIDKLMMDFISCINNWILDLENDSLRGNPVVTHQSLLNVKVNIEEEINSLWDKLREIVQKGEKIETLEILGSHATCAKQIVEKDQKFKEEVDI